MDSSGDSLGLFLGFPALILRNCGFGVLHDDSDASAIPRIAEQADLDYMMDPRLFSRPGYIYSYVSA